MTTHYQGVSYSASDRGGVKATLTVYDDDWDNVDSYVNDSYEAAITLGSTEFQIGRSTLPGKDWLVLKSVEIKPWVSKVGEADTNGLPTCPEGCLLTLVFETVEYELRGSGDGEPWLTHAINADISMFTYPNAAMAWEPTNATSTTVSKDQLPAFPETHVRHNLQWQNVYDPPLGSLYAYLATVNDAPFFGHPAGTVMCSKIDATYTMTRNLAKRYNLSIDCLARIVRGMAYGGGSIGWNHFLRDNPADGDIPWQKIQIKSADAVLDDPFTAVDETAPAVQTDILPETDYSQLLTLFGYQQPPPRPMSL
jgi:hypothetical protein